MDVVKGRKVSCPRMESKDHEMKMLMTNLTVVVCQLFNFLFIATLRKDNGVCDFSSYITESHLFTGISWWW